MISARTVLFAVLVNALSSVSVFAWTGDGVVEYSKADYNKDPKYTEGYQLKLQWGGSCYKFSYSFVNNDWEGRNESLDRVSNRKCYAQQIALRIRQALGSDCAQINVPLEKTEEEWDNWTGSGARFYKHKLRQLRINWDCSCVESTVLSKYTFFNFNSVVEMVNGDPLVCLAQFPADQQPIIREVLQSYSKVLKKY